MPADKLAYEPLIDPENFGPSTSLVRKLVLALPPVDLEGNWGGESVTRRIGLGLEKDGIRDFEPGDNERRIDYKKTEIHPQHTKQLREYYREDKPNVWIVSDAPQSRNTYDIQWGFPQQDIGISAVMAAGFMAVRQALPVAYIGVGDQRVRPSTLRPECGDTAMLTIGRTMLNLAKETQPASSDLETKRLADGINFAAQRAAKNVVVIVSDFRADALPSGDSDEKGARQKSELEKAVERLAIRSNKIIAVEINSPWHKEIPRGRDVESGGQKGPIWTGGRKAQAVRQEYAAIEDNNRAQIMRIFRQAGARHIRLSTEEGRWLTSMAHQLNRAA